MNLLSSLLGNAYLAISPLLGAISNTHPYGYESQATEGGLALLLGGAIIFIYALFFGLLIIMVVSMWIIFEKAGKPGWVAIVPIYNLIIWLEIVKKPIWWIILFFIPMVNLVISFMLSYYLALAFGKRIGFTIGLILLPFIFFPILAFGKSTYNLGGQSNFTANIPPQSMPPQQGI